MEGGRGSIPQGKLENHEFTKSSPSSDLHPPPSRDFIKSNGFDHLTNTIKTIISPCPIKHTSYRQGTQEISSILDQYNTNNNITMSYKTQSLQAVDTRDFKLGYI